MDDVYTFCKCICLESNICCSPGVVGVASCTRKATEEVLADLSLKHQMTSQDVVQLVTQVGTRMAANAPGGGGGGGSLGSCIRQYLTPREPLLQVRMLVPIPYPFPCPSISHPAGRGGGGGGVW